MSPTTTFEDEVRAMLARRAADIPPAEDGVAPVLPVGLRIPIDERPPARRGAWLAVAAAVLVVAGAVGLAVAGGDEGERETAATTASTASTAATEPLGPPGPEDRPLQLEALPEEVNPVAGPILGIGEPAATPEEAMAGVLGARLGVEVGPAIPYSWLEGALPDDRWAAYWYPTTAVDARSWPDPDPDARAGSVVARRDDAGWHVVAVTDQALDLRAVHRRGGGLGGAVWATSAAPLRVTVATLDGEVLGDTALTTAPGADPTGRSVLALDDLDVDAGDQPVVLVVEAGDRPGQIGIDGVRAAALSAVVLPAPAPAEEGDAGPTTTTAGPPPDTVGPVIGVGHRSLPLDAPIVTRVAALLPAGTSIGHAEHAYVAKPGSNDDVIVRESAEGDGPGYSVLVSRTGQTYSGTATPTPVPWGTVWIGADADEATSAEDVTSNVWARSTDGVAVQVLHRSDGGAPVTAEALIAVAERLVADPVVRAVAAGGDPSGS